MILTRENARKKFNEDKDYEWGCIVFDLSRYERDQDSNKIRCSFKILDYLNVIDWANQVYKDLGLDKRIDTDPVYKILAFVMEGKPITDNEIVEYFKGAKEIENFYTLVERFYQIDVHVPYTVQLMLFGMTYDDADKILSTFDKTGNCDKYGELFFYYACRDDKPLDKFLKEAKALVLELNEFLAKKEVVIDNKD